MGSGILITWAPADRPYPARLGRGRKSGALPEQERPVCYFVRMNADQNACAPDFSKDRVLIRQLSHYAGQEVMISGWVDVRRDQGKLVFFDFRDRTGFIQGVVL